MISFRPLTENDLSFLLETRNDKSTRKQLENDSIFSLEEAVHWFRNNININNPWLIILFNNNPIGYFRITILDEETIMLGCDIHRIHRRKGLAKLAYTLYLDELKKNKLIKLIKLWVFKDNEVAYNLYLKLGFIETSNKKIIRERLYIEMTKLI